MENIINIEEVENVEVEGYSYRYMDGYAITTDKQVIKLLIDNGQSCCERWGYFMSQDDLESFMGTNIIDISLTDTCQNTKKFEDKNIYGAEVMFVNIFTDRGLLQFVAYNEHNGYYGHNACIISEQLKHRECL